MESQCRRKIYLFFVAEWKNCDILMYYEGV